MWDKFSGVFFSVTSAKEDNQSYVIIRIIIIKIVYTPLPNKLL